MQARIDFLKTSPKVYQAMLGLEACIRASGLEHSLLHLVKIRASLMNRCAFCLDMHTQDARADGETERRIDTLAGWREAPFYTMRERAALLWAEAVTDVADTHVPDSAYDEVRAQFSEAEIVNLTLAVVAINGWNRLCVAFRTPAGTYKTGAGNAAAARAQSRAS
ncbi:MAG: carboxymuconolactone decarboxylase family protein [Lysobacterales bacterium]|jgi:AhpD family alkylhydroperoxidase